MMKLLVCHYTTFFFLVASWYLSIEDEHHVKQMQTNAFFFFLSNYPNFSRSVVFYDKYLKPQVLASFD